MARDRGTGSIVELGPDRWRVRVNLGIDPVTKRRQRRDVTVRGKKADAQRVLNELVARRDRGIDVAPDKITVAEYLERWLDGAAQLSVSPRTLARYRQLTQRLVPLLGSVRLQRLRPAEISWSYQQLLAEGLSPRTVLHHHRVLKQSLQQAVRWQLLGANPAEGAIAPRPPRREMRVLSSDEVTALLDECTDEEFRRLLFVAVATGLRLGELLALRWRDLDQENLVLSVQRTVQFLDGLTSFTSPKTMRGNRTVAYSTSTAEILQEHRRSQLATRLRLGEAWRNFDLIFPAADGSPAKVSNVSHRFANLARRAGLQVRFHDLRHTMATLALRAGIHPKVVSERLGHASIQITLDTYSHVMPDIQSDAAEAIEHVLPSPSTVINGRKRVKSPST